MVPLNQSKRLHTVGMFAGIGGLELGMEQAGHSTVGLCEIMDEARHVLENASKTHHASLQRKPFERAEFFKDVRSKEFNEWFLDSNRFDMITAGFPCQDLSQAGRTKGIDGENSGLIGEALDLIEKRMKIKRPKWVLLENVPFMRTLEGGRAMSFVLSRLESLGYWWSYREVDAHSFGLPQRRVRLYILACLEGAGDPRDVLLVDDVESRAGAFGEAWDRHACGFYWTEGNRGLGWAPDAVPTIKGGSGLGIPSPPAIMLVDKRIILPDIRDAERLQGFPAGWTESAIEICKKKGRIRWQLVGNAVSVRVANWIGERLMSPGTYNSENDQRVPYFKNWPKAAWYVESKYGVAETGNSPKETRYHQSLLAFLLEEPNLGRKPLSKKAASGFLSRFERSSLMTRKPRCRQTLIEALRAHISNMISHVPGKSILLEH